MAGRKKNKDWLAKREQQELAEKKEQQVNFNVKIAEHLAHIQEVPTPRLNDPKDIDRACIMYFDYCAKDDVRPTVSALATVLGVSRLTLLGIVNGTVKNECREIIGKWYSLLEVTDEVAMKESKINPVAGIFLMKNNHGYVDEMKHKIVDEEESDEEIERRYRERHEIVSDQ